MITRQIEKYGVHVTRWFTRFNVFAGQSSKRWSECGLTVLGRELGSLADDWEKFKCVDLFTNHTSAEFPWSLRSNRKKETDFKVLVFLVLLALWMHSQSVKVFVGDFTDNCYICSRDFKKWVSLHRDKPKNRLTGACNQRAASHGKKRQLVWIAKPLSDITGQRSSLVSILILTPPSPHTVFFLWYIFSDSQRCQHGAVWPSLSQLLSVAHQRDTQSCCSDTCLCARAECLTTDIRMPAASCVSLFFYSEGRGCQWSEESRAELEQEGTEEPFPPRLLLTQIWGCTHLPGILLLPIHLSSPITHSLEGHPQPLYYCIWLSLPTWLD